jgi:hypothetical protein
MGSLKRLSKVSIFLISGIRAHGSVRYGGVAQARTKSPCRRDKMVQVASMDEHPWSEGKRVMAWA